MPGPMTTAPAPAPAAAKATGPLTDLVVIEMGAGTAIPSVRRFGQRIVHEFGGRLVRINPRESAVPSTLGIGLNSGSLRTLAEIDRMLCSA